LSRKKKKKEEDKRKEKRFDIEFDFSRLKFLKSRIYIEARLSDKVVKKYVEDLQKAKRLFNAVFKVVRHQFKQPLKRSFFTTSEILFYSVRNADYYPYKFKQNLKRFLESGEWFVVFYEYDYMFRFMVYLGLPADDLLEFVIFWGNLSKEGKRSFIIYFLFEIWKNLKKTENLIDYLIEKHEDLKKKQRK